MKKLQLLILALVMGMFSMNAQVQDVSPVSTQSTGTNSEALFDLLYTLDIGANGSIGANGNAGVMYINGQYWVSAWASDLIHILDTSGAFVETITIPGITGTRSMSTDGTNLFIGAAGLQIYVVDPVTRTLTNTINITTGSDASARMVTYDPMLDGGLGGFWIGNFGSDIAAVNMIGIELTVIPAATHGTTIYGGAVDNISPGGPFLWIHNQGTSQDLITQLDPTTGMPTGVEYDFLADGTAAGAATVLAGGLFISEVLSPTAVALVGVSQSTPSDLIFAVELTPIVAGTNDNALSDFTLYPNPATRGVVNIETTMQGEKQVVVFDVLGKMVINTVISDTELNVSSLNEGVYMVQVTQNDATATRKLIIK